MTYGRYVPVDTTFLAAEGAAPKRRHINWNATDPLAVLKMLAWVGRYRAGAEGQEDLWCFVEDYCEQVIEWVLGEAGVTLYDVIEHTRRTQGLDITPRKLAQRADKVERYGEFNGWETEVEEAVA